MNGSFTKTCHPFASTFPTSCEGIPGRDIMSSVYDITIPCYRYFPCSIKCTFSLSKPVRLHHVPFACNNYPRNYCLCLCNSCGTVPVRPRSYHGQFVLILRSLENVAALHTSTPLRLRPLKLISEPTSSKVPIPQPLQLLLTYTGMSSTQQAAITRAS